MAEAPVDSVVAVAESFFASFVVAVAVAVVVVAAPVVESAAVAVEVTDFASPFCQLICST